LNDGRGNFTRSEPSAFPGAFEKRENSLTSGDDNKADAVAALSSRYSPEPWQEDRCAVSPLSALEPSQGQRFLIVASATGDSSLGRARPSVAIHS
jgi:hypothetical protein